MSNTPQPLVEPSDCSEHSQRQNHRITHGLGWKGQYRFRIGIVGNFPATRKLKPHKGLSQKL